MMVGGHEKVGGWHYPFVPCSEASDLQRGARRRISSARAPGSPSPTTMTCLGHTVSPLRHRGPVHARPPRLTVGLLTAVFVVHKAR